MDVGLMLSRNEAFGRVTVEYMMQNLAVIASDTGANPEIIKNGLTGLLYHYGDAVHLAEQMLYYVENVDKMKEVAKEGMSHVHKCFTSTQNSLNIYSTYCELINLQD